jgi:hypothetical protein
LIQGRQAHRRRDRLRVEKENEVGRNPFDRLRAEEAGNGRNWFLELLIDFFL